MRRYCVSSTFGLVFTEPPPGDTLESRKSEIPSILKQQVVRISIAVIEVFIHLRMRNVSINKHS